jgi:hypothetical protein
MEGGREGGREREREGGRERERERERETYTFGTSHKLVLRCRCDHLLPSRC